MTEKFSWSTGIGNWFGVPVRLHIFLLLFIVAIFSVEWQVTSNNPMVVGTGWITCIVLIISLLIHELAHVFAINNLGGEVKSISLVPWGRNSEFVYPSSTGSRAIVHMAGPFASGFIFVIGAMLLLQTGDRNLYSIINPFSPNVFDANDWEKSLMAIVTWVNFQIFIVNLIPCYPFDGANVLRAMFESINSDLSRVKIETTIMAIGHLVAVAMVGVAFLLPQTAYSSPIETPWAILMIAGITLIFCSRFSCHQEISELIPNDWDDDLDDFEGLDPFYDEDATVDFSDDDQYSQWLNEKRAEREQMERELEEEEERRSDEILAKLHKDGAESLSDEDKALLARVSERIRKRRQGV